MRVLITRPEPGAGRTAAELARRGFEPVLLPLSRTVPLEANREVLNGLEASAYAATSAAALRHWKPRAASVLMRPFHAVGAATAEAAREAGFRDVRAGDAGGAELAMRIGADFDAGLLSATRANPLVYAAGRIRSPAFETRLERHGVPFATVEIYDMEKISYSTDFVLRQFPATDPVAVCFYSANAVRLFRSILEGHEEDKRVQNSHFLCLSDQIAREVPASLRSNVKVASTPREVDLLEVLDRLRGGR